MNDNKPAIDKVDNFPVNPVKPGDSVDIPNKKLHHLSQALRKNEEGAPGSFLKTAPVLVSSTPQNPTLKLAETDLATCSINKQYIPGDTTSLTVQKTTSCKSTILEDVAAINALFGE